MSRRSSAHETFSTPLGVSLPAVIVGCQVLASVTQLGIQLPDWSVSNRNGDESEAFNHCCFTLTLTYTTSRGRQWHFRGKYRRDHRRPSVPPPCSRLGQRVPARGRRTVPRIGAWKPQGFAAANPRLHAKRDSGPRPRSHDMRISVSRGRTWGCGK